MKEIKLTKGKFALVDDEDFEKLNKFKWCCDSNGYAMRGVYLGRKEGKLKIKSVLMHRVIIATENNFDTDHINGNRLDNRKLNLRQCNRSENRMNSRKAYKSATGYKGVFFNIKKKKDGSEYKYIKAQIKVNNKSMYLGSYKSLVDAAKAYNNAAIKYYGDFALLNKVA